MKLLYERVQARLSEFESYIYEVKHSLEEIYIAKESQRSTKKSKAWRKFHVGDSWPEFGTYFQLRLPIEIPTDWTGKPVELRILLSKEYTLHTPEGLVYINGRLHHGIDRNHETVRLTAKAKANEKFEVTIHLYSGEPIHYIKENLVPPHQLIECSLVLPDGKARSFYHHAKTLFDVINTLSENSRLRWILLEILGECFHRIDYRYPKSKDFYLSVEEALRLLKQKINSIKTLPSQEKVTCTGHAHIDVAWLWTLNRTRDKTIHTFSNVLDLMKRYPEFHFFQTQPQLYQYIREDKPELFQQIKRRIQEGRWEADGGMWVEADCNLTSGESLVRQFLYGQRFFEEELGTSCSVLWLPDVFGYSWALPQIMQKAEIPYFMTTKISWNQFNRIPYDTFRWRGIDGTEILTYFITTPCEYWFKTYNGLLTPEEIKGTWDEYQQKDINDEVLLAYGYGDGGGGPTEEMLRCADALQDMPGFPQVQLGRVDKFFKRLDKIRERAPVWNGELYLEYHRGTYTTQAKNKKLNREAEFRMQQTEFLATLARLAGKTYPRKDLRVIWEKILLNQFHDILPGSSIRKVYEESYRDYAWIQDKTEAIFQAATKKITKPSGKRKNEFTLVNTLGWKRLGPYHVPIPSPHLIHTTGKTRSDTQKIKTIDGESRLLIPDVPLKPLSATSINAVLQTDIDPENLQVSSQRLENDLLRIKFNDRGEIVSLYDKEIEREVLNPGEPANVFQAFEDKPLAHDAWEIDIYYQDKLLSTGGKATIRILEKGPLRATLRITKKLLAGKIEQNISLYSNSRRIDFDTKVEWSNKDVLVKVAFPVTVNSPSATYDIQFGNVQRPTHWNTSWDWARFETCAQKWVDLSEGDYGVSLLNNCKYGHDIRDRTIRLTLIKCPGAPDPQADVGVHLFTYSLYPHPGDWRVAQIPQRAYELNVPPLLLPGSFFHPHLDEETSFASVDRDNVIIESVKIAEKEDAVIVRLYECYNQRCPVTLRFHKPPRKAVECNLLERRDAKVECSEENLIFFIKPYEIRSFKVWF